MTADTTDDRIVSSQQHDSRWPVAPMAQLSALLEREGRDGYGSLNKSKFLENDVASMIQTWRHKICDWYYEFIDQYDFDREVAGVALNYFDRYMFHQTSSNFLTREKFQLVSITSLYLAIKIHSICEDRSARAKALGALYYGKCFEASDDLADMETEMLQTLDWQLNPPTMHQFAMNYVVLHPLARVSDRFTSYLYEATRYQVELALYVPHLLEQFKPSVLAFAAMLNASEKVDPRVLTPGMKEQWCSIMPFVHMDPIQVSDAQAALTGAFPQLPDVDRFEAFRIDVSDHEEHDAIPMGRPGSVSPTNITNC